MMEIALDPSFDKTPLERLKNGTTIETILDSKRNNYGTNSEKNGTIHEPLLEPILKT